MSGDSLALRPESTAAGSGERLPVIPDVTLHREIARGGMGIVYRGRQAFLDREVAVKLLAPHLGGERFAARFRREARILAGIKHPNIVACHTAGTTASGQSYLVMELVDGPDLLSWIAEHGALHALAALRVTRQLASALGHAADLGVIHRDVKPENVLLETPTSTSLDVAFPFVPKLVDLGLARMAHETGLQGMTSPGAVIGTLATMAPEQLDAPDSVDFRADIYGLGCVLYHMLTGAPAFTSTKLTDVVAEKRRDAPPDPRRKCPGLPAAVGKIVTAMLARDCADRPESYRALIAGLDDAIASLASEPVRPTPRDKVPAPSPRGPASPLLQTAEFQFLAAESASAAERPQGETGAGFVAPGEEAAPPRSRALRPLILGAIASVLVLAATPALLPNGDTARKRDLGTKAPAAAPPGSAGKAPALAIRGLDDTLRPHLPIDLRGEVTPALGGKPRYRWSAQPEGVAYLSAPTAPSTTLRLSGLPGDAFTIALEVDGEGVAPLRAERQLELDYPAVDLCADFLAKSLELPARARLQGDWTRRDDGAIVCVAPDAPCSRARRIPGTVWRLEGLLLPERLGRRAYAQTAVCLRVGPSRQLVLVCERDGQSGEIWSIALQEAERDEGRTTFAFRPLPQPKAVITMDREGKLPGARYTITRRGGEVVIRLGFPGVHESAEHREHVRADADNTMLSLFTRGGRGVFKKLVLW